MLSFEKEFEKNVFNKEVMKKYLSDATYKSLMKTIENGLEIDPKISDNVAEGMKKWALSNGATHFTHWFQPMTGITAEKHEAFINLKDGKLISEFKGKELAKGEPDASSFPNGGIRSTFEARGYTAWDPTSFAFIKDEVLCIPTAFYSYSGESLDKKTPLLRSIQSLKKESKRILKLFKEKDTDVIVNVGAEQEYFLIDEKEFIKRKDLIYTGRTLFGAPPSKGQELEDHYFGTIKPKVLAFMKELDVELIRLGVAAKTRHNEVSPAQHEIAVIFEEANKATDHNQLIMETLKNTAKKHGLTCLLNEKPFAGVNGSGKHCNWSISTKSGKNLFEIGTTAKENVRFLLFLVAVIKAIYENQDLMRISIASAGNDQRLGVAEAPPAIISIFLGDQLMNILESLKTGGTIKTSEKEHIHLGVDTLPKLPKDSTDRNRTSPFAFTGNKFEFRMVGSNSSIAGPLFIINTIIAKTLKEFADELEVATHFDSTLNSIIRETVIKNERIIFNGNNYSKSWEEEAEKRGLLNLKTTVDALNYFDNEKNIQLFDAMNILSPLEVKSRTELLFEEYYKTIRIEAVTMRNIARKEFLPSVSHYTNTIIKTLKNKKDIKRYAKVSTLGESLEREILEKLGVYSDLLLKTTELLETLLASNKCKEGTPKEIANFYATQIIPSMTNLREVVDKLELVVDKKCWPLSSYGEILYSIR